ncbi:hypothetical protein [Dactylosporangium sp. NPDC005555]
MDGTGTGARFGEVAEVYDDARPGYPPEAAAAAPSWTCGPV